MASLRLRRRRSTRPRARGRVRRRHAGGRESSFSGRRKGQKRTRVQSNSLAPRLHLVKARTDRHPDGSSRLDFGLCRIFFNIPRRPTPVRVSKLRVCTHASARGGPSARSQAEIQDLGDVRRQGRRERVAKRRGLGLGGSQGKPVLPFPLKSPPPPPPPLRFVRSGHVLDSYFTPPSWI